MKLLIADKDQPFSMLLQSYLEDHGHQVEIAADAIECLTRARHFRPELVILGSLLWGGSDGVIVAMNEEEPLRQIPIILLQNPPLRESESSTNQIIHRLERPIRLGVLSKYLVSLQQTQNRISHLWQTSYGKFCDELAHRLTALQQSTTDSLHHRPLGDASSIFSREQDENRFATAARCAAATG